MPMLETAIETAKAAGAVLANYFEMTGLERELKDDKSFVTKADKEAEAIIVGSITRHYPDHGILGEEGADVNPEAEYQWVIDPLDGTSNFVNGIPIFAVSIGILHQGKPFIGVVYNPITESLYAAEKGKGATYNGKSIAVSAQAAGDGIVTFGPGRKESARFLKLFVTAKETHFKSVRFLGSTALELAYVARGGTEAFVCIGLSLWDFAAGKLLVTEAGGMVTDYDGNEADVKENYFIASNGAAHQNALNLVKSVPS